MSDFDLLFDNSDLPNVLSKAKTLSKEECRQIDGYFRERKPITILEFGVQHGCSTRAFLDMAAWSNLEIDLHSWDIKDTVRHVDKKRFSLHIEDICGRESDVFDKYDPDLVFLDAHPHDLTRNLMQECLKRKVDFMCHDVCYAIGHDAAKLRSNNWTKKNTLDVQWELYHLCDLVDDSLWKNDSYENDELTVSLCRDRYGLGIVRFK
jgi:hypothetical protein